MTKEIWFQYLIDNKQYWVNGVTLKRLAKAKPFIFKDETTMSDILQRHRGNQFNPKELKEYNLGMHNHGISNFLHNVVRIMRDQGIIKI